MELKVIALGFIMALFMESSERASSQEGEGGRSATMKTSGLREDSWEWIQGHSLQSCKHTWLTFSKNHLGEISLGLNFVY